MVDALTLQYAEEKGEKRGEKRGERRGEKRGVQQGIRRGQQDLLVHQMTRRIGLVPERIVSLLDTLTTDQLVAFSDALLDLRSYAEVESWLSRQ